MNNCETVIILPSSLLRINVIPRFWKVISSNTRNSTGHLTGYKIMPAPKCLPFAPLARAAHLKRAQFLDHQLWVTAFHAEERYPGYVHSNRTALQQIVCVIACQLFYSGIDHHEFTDFCYRCRAQFSERIRDHFFCILPCVAFYSILTASAEK